MEATISFLETLMVVDFLKFLFLLSSVLALKYLLFLLLLLLLLLLSFNDRCAESAFGPFIANFGLFKILNFQALVSIFF